MYADGTSRATVSIGLSGDAASIVVNHSSFRRGLSCLDLRTAASPLLSHI